MNEGRDSWETIIGRHKAAAAALAVALSATLAAPTASTAEAATCATVPGSTIGTDVSIAGQKHRVTSPATRGRASDGTSWSFCEYPLQWTSAAFYRTTADVQNGECSLCDQIADEAIYDACRELAAYRLNTWPLCD